MAVVMAPLGVKTRVVLKDAKIGVFFCRKEGRQKHVSSPKGDVTKERMNDRLKRHHSALLYSNAVFAPVGIAELPNGSENGLSEAMLA